METQSTEDACLGAEVSEMTLCDKTMRRHTLTRVSTSMDRDREGQRAGAGAACKTCCEHRDL